MKIKLIFGLFVCIVFLIDCNNNTKNKSETNSFENTNFKQLVESWNNAHNSKDVAVFSNLFDNLVLFYGTQLDKNTCIESKLTFFKQNPDFYEQIFGDIQIDKLNDSIVNCSFVKRVTVNQETKDYPSYLTFKRLENAWKISVEGDKVTDNNIAVMKSTPTVQSIPADAIKGDFDGDGKLEYAWLDAPKQDTTKMMGCIGECNCYIRFSNPKMPPIKIESCIGGKPKNEGDLDGDGGDEISIVPEWYTSCWQRFIVYSFKNGKWIEPIPSFSIHCNQQKQGITFIEKDPHKKGYVITRESFFTGKDIIVKTKSVKIL